MVQKRTLDVLLNNTEGTARTGVYEAHHRVQVVEDLDTSSLIGV
jgi:hypothetical protein